MGTRSRFLLLLPLLALLPNPAQAQLRITANNRFIEDVNGKPFFWLGDTAWELFHRLDRNEAEHYLRNRAEKGFTVIQAVALAELEGLTVANAEGNLPLVDNDPTRLNEKYFKHVDFIIDKAEELGLYIGLLPTWGDKFNKQWGVGPEVFTPDNARTFGALLARRYQHKPVIWILGGDRRPADEEDLAIIRAMAEGIRGVVADRQLITYHPQGGLSSSEFFHQDEWLDLNLYQSGHGELNNPNYRKTEHDYKLQPTKPVIDGEPAYEDHPINWNAQNGWFDDFDSRRSGYWSMLSGAAGHTYGNHNIWQMWQPGRGPISQARTPWQQALDYPGAFQAGIMGRLFESRPWQRLVPANNIVKRAPNTGGKEAKAAVADDGSFAFVYIPYGTEITVDISGLQGDELTGWWFNPRNGAAIEIGPLEKKSDLALDPPLDEARGNDWVLVVDAGDFGRPGQ